MQKPFIVAVTYLASAAIFLSPAQAQQPPASTVQQAPATPAQAPAATPKKAPVAKAGQAPVKKTLAPLTLKTPKDKVSYAIGQNIGKSLKRDAVDVDPAILLRAIKDVLADNKPLLTEQEVQATLTTLQADLHKKQELLTQQAAETNKKESDAFLAANKTKDGVVTLPSGLQYKVLHEGTGPKPTTTDSVSVNYRGTLLNGTEFDSSYKRGQPATFGVGQIIKGWTEALQLMPVGSKWQLFVPPDLAYGARGAGRDIGPNATLVFEVELLSIQPKGQPAPATAPASTPNQTPPPAPTPTPTPIPPPTPTPTPKP
ncbi:MAG TPA: FKBP-type peptidyl-prolyl cis-trans isomerase [Candidatus Acidoferrum sp.]|nr:FKBP-type peptidyl-prolyl cis-trans isomerase [Candidatus Acidoferrum sp.]